MNAKTLLSLCVAVALGLAATWVGRNIILGNRTLSGAAPETASGAGFFFSRGGSR